MSATDRNTEALRLLDSLLAMPHDRPGSWEAERVEALEEHLTPIRDALTSEQYEVPYEGRREPFANADRHLERLFELMCDAEQAFARAGALLATEEAEGSTAAMEAATGLGIARRETTLAYEATVRFVGQEADFQRVMELREGTV